MKDAIGAYDYVPCEEQYGVPTLVAAQGPNSVFRPAVHLQQLMSGIHRTRTPVAACNASVSCPVLSHEANPKIKVKVTPDPAQPTLLLAISAPLRTCHAFQPPLPPPPLLWPPAAAGPASACRPPSDPDPFAHLAPGVQILVHTTSSLLVSPLALFFFFLFIASPAALLLTGIFVRILFPRKKNLIVRSIIVTSSYPYSYLSHSDHTSTRTYLP